MHFWVYKCEGKSQSRIQNPNQISKMECFPKTVNGF